MKEKIKEIGIKFPKTSESDELRYFYGF